MVRKQKKIAFVKSMERSRVRNDFKPNLEISVSKFELNVLKQRASNSNLDCEKLYNEKNIKK